MSESAYLTADELYDLTGKRQRPAQIKWLRKNRWRHAVADGNPRVAREYWRRRMVDEDAEDGPKAWEPGFLQVSRPQA